MATEIQDLQDMNNYVFDDDQNIIRVLDPNLLLQLQVQGLAPCVHDRSLIDSASLDCGLGLDGGFDYGQNMFHHNNPIDVVEVGKERQLIADPNGFVDLSSISDALTSSSSTLNSNSDSPEDVEGFSDILFSYINQILMEEDSDDKFGIHQEHPALLAAEKSLYEILEEKLSLSPDQNLSYSSPSSESLDENVGNHLTGTDGSNTTKFLPIDDNLPPHVKVGYRQQLERNHTVIDFSSQSYSSHGFSYAVENQDSLKVSDLLVQTPPTWQFERGLKEAQKLNPCDKKSNDDIDANDHDTSQEVTKEIKLNETRKYLSLSSTGRKNPHDEELDVMEGRNNKHSAISTEEPSHNDMLDEVLLFDAAVDSKNCQTKLKVEASKSSHASHAKGSSGGRRRGKRQPKKEVVDLRTMLVHCAQAVSSGDGQNANELLKRIRQHSSLKGDGNQRMAHYFADGLEARLAGTGSQVYRNHYTMKLSMTDVLKAYRLYTSACPFKKVSHFFSDQIILNVAKNVTSLHIIDFGIYYGLQWPCFMQQLSKRPGGPPKLRITGIDLPMRGFRPTELVDETGRRLSEYARKFNIPFTFQAIAAKWETLQVDDLNIDENEVLVVNCLYRFKILMDESVVVDSPRNTVLHLIRKLKPTVFVHGIVNGSYGVPFFVSRFREALFNFSSLFDMIETNVLREDDTRMLIEKILLGRDIISVIACEGSDRSERPESYKQWQIRNINAGFTQIPLDRDIVKKAKDKVKVCYHKDFVMDEDSQWLLQGWKGRILHGLSSWKPNNSS